MSEAATRAETTTRSRTSKQAAISTQASPFLQFDMPKMELPETLRDAAVKWIDQGKETFEKAVKATEGMNDALEESFSGATKGTLDYSAKVTEAMHANTIAVFEFAHDLIAAKSLPEVMEISNTRARRQLEALTAQSQELWAFAQQLATGTVKPMTGGLSKVLGARTST